MYIKQLIHYCISSILVVHFGLKPQARRCLNKHTFLTLKKIPARQSATCHPLLFSLRHNLRPTTTEVYVLQWRYFESTPPLLSNYLKTNLHFLGGVGARARDEQIFYA